MRHRPDKFCNGDQLEVQIIVRAEVLNNLAVAKGRRLTLRVLYAESRSNSQPITWRHGEDGALDITFEVGAKQRLLALGVSARQRETLKGQLAGLSVEDTRKLLAELTCNAADSADSQGGAAEAGANDAETDLHSESGAGPAA